MPNFISDPEIQEAIERGAVKLRSMAVGETVEYSKFFVSSYALARARLEVEKTDGVRFGTVRKVGVKRMPAEDVPNIGTASTRRIHRAAKKTVSRLSDLRSYNDMQPSDRLRVAAHRMIAGAVAEKTTRSAVKQTEDSVKTAGAAIDFGTVLKK